MTKDEMIAEMQRLQSRAERAEAALERMHSEQENAPWFVAGSEQGEKGCPYRGLIDLLDALVVFIDTEEIVCHANRYAVEFLGLDADEIQGMYLRDVLDGILAPKPEQDHALATLLSDPDLQRIEEVDMIRPGGDVSCVSWASRSVHDADGELLGVVAVGTDVTARRDAQEQSEAYQEALRSLTAEVALADERQRREIATRIHEEISQNLAYTKLRVGSLMGCVEDKCCEATVEEVNDLLDQAITGTRTLAFELSPPLLHELGFCEAVEWLTEQFEDHCNVTCDFSGNCDSEQITDAISMTMFRAVGELLNNIARHSDARTAHVKVAQDDNMLEVLISDDGRGFNAEEVLEEAGRGGAFGLFNIRERLDYLGGKMWIDSDPLTGTRVRLAAPVNGQQSQ